MRWRTPSHFTEISIHEPKSALGDMDYKTIKYAEILALGLVRPNHFEEAEDPIGETNYVQALLAFDPRIPFMVKQTSIVCAGASEKVVNTYGEARKLERRKSLSLGRRKPC